MILMINYEIFIYYKYYLIRFNLNIYLKNLLIILFIIYIYNIKK